MYLREILKLYGRFTGFGLVSLASAILLGISPKLRLMFGPYLWIVLLCIFFYCVFIILLKEYLRYLERIKFASRVSVEKTYKLIVLNEEGDCEVHGYDRITNNGKELVYAIPPIMVGVDNPTSAPTLSLTQKPDDKEINLLCEYHFKEKQYYIFAQEYILNEGLSPKESLEYNYSYPLIRMCEKGAFTEKGSVISARTRDHWYNTINYAVSFPSGYRFEILDIKVKNTLGISNIKETYRANKLFKPKVDGKEGEILMKWNIIKPLPQHEYVCYYRLCAK